MEDKYLITIPTVRDIKDNLLQYITLAINSNVPFDFLIVDDSTTQKENRDLILKIQEILKSRGSSISIYHFGTLKQKKFFRTLISNGIPKSALHSFNIKPSFGVAQNKKFLASALLGARGLVSFDDDTYPYEKDILVRYYKILKNKHIKKPLAIRGDYVGERGTDYSLFKSRGHSPKKTIQKFFEILEYPESKPTFRERHLKGNKMLIGGNFAINQAYKHIVCPPMYETGGIEEFFPTDYVISHGGKIIPGAKVRHSYHPERIGSRRFRTSIEFYMLRFVRRHLAYYVFNKMETEFGTISPALNFFTSRFISGLGEELRRILITYRALLLEFNKKRNIQSVRYLSAYLKYRSNQNIVIKQILDGTIEFLKLNQEWDHILDHITKIDPSDIF